jgi:anti-sigma factor RsiW
MAEFFDHVRFRWEHWWAPRRMSAYLDDELDASGRDRMEHHVGECPECRSLLAGLRVILQTLHRLPSPAGDVDVIQIATAVRGRLSERE